MNMTTSWTADAVDTAQPTQRRTPLPAWSEILLVLATFCIVREIPGIEYTGPVALIASVLVITVLLRLRGTGWSSLGLRGPQSARDVLKGAGMVVLVFIGAALTNAIAMVVLGSMLGAEAEREFMDVSTFPKYLMMMGIVWTTASFCEEMVFRGFLMHRAVEMFGSRRFAWILAALFQAVLFGLVHAYQGIGGILTTGLIGLTFGLLYLVARRNLWPTIIGHGLVNTFGITVLHLQATGAINTSGLG